MFKLINSSIFLTLVLTTILGCTKEDFIIKGAKPIIDGDYYVAVWGSDDNPGTFKEPWLTFKKAIEVAVPGNIIYFRGGVYYMDETIYMNPEELGVGAGKRGRSGTPDNPICYFNYPGETPIFDFSRRVPTGNYNSGMVTMLIDFIKMRGFTIRGIYQFREGVEASGLHAYACSNMHYENIIIHDVSGAAFRYSGGFGDVGYFRYPYDSTYYINCDAFDLCDSLLVGAGQLGGKADGWKTHNDSIGAYFYWEGCRAWNCSDDGFDPGGSCLRVFENCWSWGNGKFDGDGNGFKCGGPQHDLDFLTLRITNCLAAFNKRYGIMELDHEGYYENVAIISNNTSYDNTWGFGNYLNTAIDRDNMYTKNIAYNNYQEVAFSGDYVESDNTWNHLGGYNWEIAIPLTDKDFENLNPYELSRPRKADGSLPDITFLKPASGSVIVEEKLGYTFPWTGN